MSKKNNKSNNFFSRERFNERKKNRQIFHEDIQYNLRGTSLKKKITAFAKLLLLLFIMIGIPIILFFTFKDTFLSADALAQLPTLLESKKSYAFVILIVLQMLQIVVCFLPGQPIQFASSYLYGFGWGYLISIIGAVIGSILTYYLADFLGKDALHLLFGKKKVTDYQKKLNSGRAYTIIFLIYLIPGIPKDVVSYVAGISDIKIRPFIIVSTLGRSPGLMASLLIGAFLDSKNYLGIAIVGLVALAILYMCFKNKDSIMNMIESYENKGNKDGEKNNKN